MQIRTLRSCSLKKRRLKRELINLYKYCVRRSKEHRARNTWNTEIQEIQFKHKITLIYYQGGQTREQVAQRGCGVTIPGNIENPTQHSPGQTAPADPALNRGVALDELQLSLPAIFPFSLKLIVDSNCNLLRRSVQFLNYFSPKTREMSHKVTWSYIKFTNSPSLALLGQHLTLKIHTIKCFLICS